MQKSKILFYIGVFIITLSLGIILGKNPTYPCEFEETVFINEEEKKDAVYEKAKMPKSGVLNINTATAKELTALSGIGEKMSQKIVEYREEHGRFEVREDILKIPGIGEKKFEEIKENICVE